MGRYMSKNIKDTMTRKASRKFKAEHPVLKRGEALHQFCACYMAMNSISNLDKFNSIKAIIYPVQRESNITLVTL